MSLQCVEYVVTVRKKLFINRAWNAVYQMEISWKTEKEGGGGVGEKERECLIRNGKKSTRENCILSNNFTNFSLREERKGDRYSFSYNNSQ